MDPIKIRKIEKMKVKDAVREHGIKKEQVNELFGDSTHVFCIHFWDCWEVTLSMKKTVCDQDSIELEE